MKATDRTETHEEIDERKEKNLERERARKEKRMMAFSDDEDLDSEGESRTVISIKKSSSFHRRQLDGLLTQ